MHLYQNLVLKENKDSLWLFLNTKGEGQLKIKFGITNATVPVSGWTDFIGKIDGKVTKYFDVDYCKKFPNNSNLTLNKKRDSQCVFLGLKSNLINSFSRIQLARSLFKNYITNSLLIHAQSFGSLLMILKLL